MSKKNFKRKNRKIRFSEDNYIQKYYMKNKKAIIPIELMKIDDLYMKHDYKKMQLSDEICKYIEEIAYMVPINTDIVLEIHCPKISEELQDKIKKNIKNNYGMEIDEIDFERQMANRRSDILFVIGIFLLVLNIFLDSKIKVTNVLSNFLCVVWWVAIWDMIEMRFLDNSDRKWNRLNFQQLYDSQVTFVFDGEDTDENDD